MKQKLVLIICELDSKECFITNNLSIIKKSVECRYLTIETDNLESMISFLDNHNPDCLVLSEKLINKSKSNFQEIADEYNFTPMVVLYDDAMNREKIINKTNIKYLNINEVSNHNFILKHAIENIALINEMVRETALKNDQLKQEILLHTETHENLKISCEVLQQANQEVNELAVNLLSAKNKAVQAKIEADEASTYKTFFLAKMSHELRTPLNAIINFSEIMKSELFGKINNKKYLEYSNDINNSGNYLLKLIDDLLDLSKIEHERILLNCTKFNLNSVVNECIKNFVAQEKSQNIAIRTYFTHKAIEVLADNTRLKQIIINILSNAMNHTEKGGTISVQVYHNKKICIIIKDTGCGIAQKDLNYIFKPFHKVNPLIKNNKGSGLGLYITKKLVEAHNGELLVQSTIDKGTAVSIILPAENEAKDVPTNYDNLYGYISTASTAVTSGT